MRNGMVLGILFSLILSGQAQAQASQKTVIRGQVLDSLTRAPLEWATVAIKTLAGQPVGSVPTKQDGRFELAIPPGHYRLSVTFVGYETVTRTIHPEGKEWPVETLELLSGAVRLDEASVSATGNAIIIKKDTIEYHADSYKVTEDAMLEELVKKLDGAEIDNEGKMTVHGKEIKKVMVDGKTFFGDDPQIAVKNLPAAMVEKVQVIDRKSDQAQFTGIDDGNEETVLNLIVRPGMKNGWFGNTSAGAGYKDRYQAGGMAAYLKDDRQVTLIASGNNTNNRGFNDIAGNRMQQGRNNGGGVQGGYNMNVGGTRMNVGGNGVTTSWLGGLNVYDEWGGLLKATGNYFYNGAETAILRNSYRQNLFRNDSISCYNQSVRSETHSEGRRAALELEWTPDSLNSILFKPTVHYGAGRFDEYTRYTTLSASPDSVNDGYSTSAGRNTSGNFNGDLLFRHKFNTHGRTFSAHAAVAYGSNVTDGNNYALMRFFNGQPDTITRQQYQIRQYTVSADARLAYTEPVGNDYYAEIAYGIRVNRSTSDKDTYHMDNSGQITAPDEAYTNHYRSLFVNQRVELNLRRVREKYNWTVGVQAQPSYLHSQREGDEAPLSRNVIHFSPNGNFTYYLSDNRQFRADYRGNTNEPTITQLQPVPDNTNPLLRRMGNSTLRPEFSHSLRLSYRNTNLRSARTTIISLNTSMTLHRIVNSQLYESLTGRQLIVPVNTSGVYSVTGLLTWTTPFWRGSRFVFRSNMVAHYSQHVTLSQSVPMIPEDDEPLAALIANSPKNTTRTLSMNRIIGAGYRGHAIDVNLTVRVGYSHAWYSLGNLPPAYWNNHIGADFNWSLPASWSLAADAGYTFYIGYPDGYNRPVCLWNAEIAKVFGKQKQATLKVRVFDVLNEGRGVSHTVTDNYIEDISANTLGRYVMASFIYRFGAFDGNARSRQMPAGHRPRRP